MSLVMETVRRTVDEMHMLDPGDGVLLGISGGPDSTALLHTMHQLSKEMDIWIAAVHVNHGLRKDESIRDAEFAGSQAQGLGIPFESVTLTSLEGSQGSVQQRARKLRYFHFRRVAASCGARRIALGHHADDCIEWALMNLLQGSGLSGLRGIPPVRRDLIRPLIRIRKSEILDYLRKRSITYVEDISNSSLSYLRNRIRHTLIPFLEEQFNPRVNDALIRLLSIAALEDAHIAREAEKSFTLALLDRKDGVLRMDRAAVAEMDPAVRARVIRHAIESMAGTTQGVTFDHVQSIAQMVKKGGRSRRLDLPGGIVAGAEYGSLLVEKPAKNKAGPFSHTIHGPGDYWLPVPGVRFVVQPAPNGLAIDLKRCPSGRAYLDAGQCTFPLTIRNPLPGDRFHPLGMDAAVKLKDFFIHQRVPRSSRAMTPLVISREKIAWVAGLRLDERFKVRRPEASVLTMEINTVKE